MAASESIESSYQAAIEAGKINGAVVCATDVEGNFVYNKTFGERVLLSGEKRPQQLDDVLFLASATKLIASIAAMQCVEKGLIGLTEDVSSIVPELGKQQIITSWSDDGETPILEPRTEPITLERLLTHTAGVSYPFIDPNVGKWAEKYNAYVEGDKRPVERAFANVLAYQPGKGWMYGTGLDWAGRVVERLTGQTLGEHVQRYICDHLGITDAQFFPVTREDLRERLVDLNPDDPEATGRAVLGGVAEMTRRSKGDFGGHGLFMPGCDYIKILHSLLANDGKLLKPATVDDMFSNHLSPEATEAFDAALAGPAGPSFRVGTEGIKVGHGLGGMLTLESAEGYLGKHTMGWGGGLTFTWFVDRERNFCALGAVQAKVPVGREEMAALRNVFRHDIYRKHAAWANASNKAGRS